jgi:hypothetical protein
MFTAVATSALQADETVTNLFPVSKPVAGEASDSKNGKILAKLPKPA